MNLEAWLNLLEKRHPQAIELGLERCGTVYQNMGAPRPAKEVFTVAGTNGKGSTVAYIAAFCGALGYRYGTYTSPHIFRFNERISVMGEPVSDECLLSAFEQVEAARGEISLTYFEFTTLAGLSILSQSGLDYAVLEVGLGGRLDTVNLIDADCTVITPIGLDHQDYLGPDLDSIAAEKAGIIRPGIPVVCTQPNPPSPILQAAKNMRAPVYRRHAGFELDYQSGQGDGLLQFSMADRSLQVPEPSMSGTHQLDNLAAALSAFGLLNPGLFRKADEISHAICATRVPGRLQVVSASPEILMDVGHNGLAAEAVADYLRQSRKANVTCVLAMMADKPVEEVALQLERVCVRWFCADSPGDRGQRGEALAKRVKDVLPDTETVAFSALESALQTAVSMSGEDESILVFGSFLTVSRAARWVQNSMRHDSPDAARII